MMGRSYSKDRVSRGLKPDAKSKESPPESSSSLRLANSVSMGPEDNNRSIGFNHRDSRRMQATYSLGHWLFKDFLASPLDFSTKGRRSVSVPSLVLHNAGDLSLQAAIGAGNARA
jgi:hypothetical protein